MVKKSKVSRRERRIKKREDHTAQVQKQRKKYNKRKRNKMILNYVLIIALIAVVGFFIYNSLGDSGPGEYDDFAKCVMKSGAIMYGTDWCPHCQDQKRLFGSSFKYVNYVNCDLSSDACDLAGVEGYPTWVFASGDSASGMQSLDLLAERTGCVDES